MLLVLLSACQKVDFSPAVKVEQFDVAAAKEWWYGSFRKSAVYKQRNKDAEMYQLQWAEQPASAYAEYNKEQGFYPSWKNAKQYHGKAFDFVDVPLVSKYIVLPLPLVPGETHQDRLKIAAASMHRLLVVKQKSGATLVRVVTVIPSLSYLKAHQYLLPFISLKDLPGDFDGIVSVRKWDATEVVSWWIKSGHKRKIMMKAKVKSAIAATNGTEPVSCPPVWDIVDYHYTCIDVHEGDADEPSGYCDDPNNWLQGEPIWDWVYSPGDCYEGGEDDYCEGMTNETCMCETYGLGCDDGGEEDPPPPPPDPCTYAQPAANATTTLSQNSSYTGAKTNIQGANPNVEHTVTFGTDANSNTTASSMTSGTNSSTCTANTSWPGAFADLHNHTNDLPPSPADMYNLIGVNNNHSGYNTRMVVTPDGSVYALVVLDLAAANTFKTKYPPVSIGYGPDFPSEIYAKFDAVKDQFVIQGLSPIIAEERAMAFVLDKFNTGFTLLKQDSNGNFKRLKTDESTSNGNTTYTANNCQ